MASEQNGGWTLCDACWDFSTCAVMTRDVYKGVFRTLLPHIVIVGVGEKPDSNLLQAQVAMDERVGVVVNEDLRSTMPGVYAIGDISSFPLKPYGRVTRMEHVTNARAQATHVVQLTCEEEGNGHSETEE